MEWEILECEIAFTKHALLGKGEVSLKEKKVETFTRVRVIVNERLGISLTRQGAMSLDEQLDQAIEKKLRGPRVAWTLSQGGDVINEDPSAISQPPPSLTELRASNVVAVATRKIQYKLLYRSGSKLRQDLSQSLATVGIQDGSGITAITRINIDDELSSSLFFVNSIKLLEDCKETDVLTAPWLFSPNALSKIFLTRWHEVLTSRQHAHEIAWPVGICIRDRGLGLKRDLEGTIRRPVTFVLDGKLITKAHNQLSAEQAGVKPTGHGSLDGRFVWDMCVGPSSVDAHAMLPSDAARVIITDADWILGQRDTTSLLSLTVLYQRKRRPMNVLVKLSSVTDLLETARWCGPTQCGISQWSSPWLELTEPQRLFSLL